MLLGDAGVCCRGPLRGGVGVSPGARPSALSALGGTSVSDLSYQCDKWVVRDMEALCC